MSSICEFVAGSDTRTAITSELLGGPASTARLLDDVPASESSVYAALSALEDEQIVESDAETWRLTGRGELLADFLAAGERIDDLLATDHQYWRRHDPSVLPQWARRGMWALADCDVHLASETDPAQVVREVAEHIRHAESIDVVAPVYHDQFASAIAARDGQTRVLFTEQLVEDRAETDEPPVDLSGIDLRVGQANFALAVSPSRTLLSLPRRDGGYDAESEVMADSDQAVCWGSRLFEYCWADAEPVRPP